jgi:rare lipoprotein A
LPLGTRIQVTDAKTGRSIVVRVNDRGPFVKGRIVDLSKEAAKELGIVDRGIARVDLKVLSAPQRGG